MSELLKKTRGWKLPLLAFCGLAFTLLYVFNRPPSPMHQLDVMPPVSPFEDNVVGIGVVEPSSEVINIGTELSGVIRAVFVKVGDKVKANQPLFMLDTRDIDAQIKTLKASLNATSIQAKDADAQFAIVRDVGDKRAVSQDDFNRRKYASELAKARVNQIESQLDEAKTTKDRLTVRAPIDGEILSVDLRPGEFATAGNTSESLMRMGDTKVLHVRVEIDEENAGKVGADAVAKGFVRGDPAHAIPLTFVRFEPYVRPKQNIAVVERRADTRVLQALYALGDTNGKIFVGQQLDVYIAAGKNKE